jgi:hypothetical protein
MIGKVHLAWSRQRDAYLGLYHGLTAVGRVRS